MLTALLQLCIAIARKERGQGLAEYAVLIAFLVLLVIVALAAMGTQLNTLWLKIVTDFPTP